MHLRHIASTASYGTLKRTFDSRPPSGTRRPSRSGDDEEPLRRHERADALAEQRIGLLERAERARVLGVDAEDAPAIARRIRSSHGSRPERSPPPAPAPSPPPPHPPPPPPLPPP